MKTVIVVLLTLTLSGCGIFMKPKPTIVVKKELVYIGIPPSLTTPCEPEEPIAVNEYMKLSIPKKEQVLVDYSISLLTTISICNDKLLGIKKLQRGN